jgi:hypothetical protein
MQPKVQGADHEQGMCKNALMFELATFADFYAMLIEDFDEFLAEPGSSRRAIHCAITAYHLHEWVWGDWLKRDYSTQQKLGVRDLNAFRTWIESASASFPIVQDLANGTKHFIRNKGFETLQFGGWGQGGYGVGPYGAKYLLVGFGEDEDGYMPAGDLLEIVVRFWRDFFRAYRPDLNLPASRHHVD